MLKSGGQGCVFLGSLPIQLYDLDDRAGERAAMALLARTRIASQIEIAGAFSAHRNTVGRLTGLFEEQGMPAVVPGKRGPKGLTR